MKTLIIGLLAFSGWAALSTHLYVCKIKGLCNETETMQNAMVGSQVVNDTLNIPKVPVAEPPGTMSIYFEFDKYEFKDDTMTNRYIDRANSYMAQNPQAVLLIAGHADAIGTDEYNLALGDRRAQAFKNYLGSKGISADRSLTETRGEREPVGDNNTSEGRAKNRRTEITIK